MTSSALVLAVVIVLFAIILTLILVPWSPPNMCGGSAMVSQTPRHNHYIPEVDNNTMRLRCVNMFMMPWHPRRKKVARAMDAGLLQDVDLVLCQEMWREKWSTHDGTLHGVATIATPTQHLPGWCFLDSGLAAIGVHATARCIAFTKFQDAAGLEVFAGKGMAVFEVPHARTGILRAATCHLQSSGKDHAVRWRQLEQGLAVCKQTGAHILAGDVNVEDEAGLEALDSIIRRCGFPRAWRPKVNQPTWADTYTLDHVWVLDPEVIQDVSIHVNGVLTKGWSDHTALDIEFTFQPAHGRRHPPAHYV